MSVDTDLIHLMLNKMKRKALNKKKIGRMELIHTMKSMKKIDWVMMPSHSWRRMKNQLRMGQPRWKRSRVTLEMIGKQRRQLNHSMNQRKVSWLPGQPWMIPSVHLLLQCHLIRRVAVMLVVH